MKQLTVHQVLPHYADVSVLLASEPGGGRFVGVPADGNPTGSFLFVEIDRVTELELERGEVSLYTIIAERSVGLIFETTDFACTLDAQEAMQAHT